MSEHLERFSPNIVDKGKKNAFELGTIAQDTDHPEVFWFRGDKYRVQLVLTDEGIEPTCTCPHGQNHHPARCYHAAAAIILGERDGTLPLPQGDDSLGDVSREVLEARAGELDYSVGRWPSGETDGQLADRLAEEQEGEPNE